jgi:hypothetical protein
LAKSWFIRPAKQRIHHIDVYRERTVLRACPSFSTMKDEEQNQEKTGWLMTVEFVTASTNDLIRTEKFLLYPKKAKPIDALSMIVGSGVLEVIAINSKASQSINLRQTERLVEVPITKELLGEPAYYETDDWCCVKLCSQRIGAS